MKQILNIYSDYLLASFSQTSMNSVQIAAKGESYTQQGTADKNNRFRNRIQRCADTNVSSTPGKGEWKDENL